MIRALRVVSLTFGVLALLLSANPAGAQVVSPRSLINQNIDEGNLFELQGNTRPEANAANDRGPVADNFQLEHMLLQLRRTPEQEQALQQFMNGLQTQGSPNFHQWLTAQEFGARFGLAKQDLDTIIRWLESHGFKVNVVYSSGMVIDFSGTAGQVREAFRTEIHNLEVNGQKHIANMTNPRIPAALAPAIVGIVSLHDFRPQTMHKMHPAKSNFTFSGTFGPTYALVPADLATIYNLNPLFQAGYSGQGQTIVVIEDTDIFSASDWNSFRSAFGLSSYSSASFTTTYPAPSSGANNCAQPGIVAPNDAEAILDAEWASAAAPSAAIRMATCADSGATFGGLIALQNLINASSQPPAIMSISYGQCETENGASANAAYYSAYQQAAAEGVSVFVAAGDSGAAGCDNSVSEATNGIGVNAFASTPFNVAVGGTDFSDTYSGTNSNYWSTSNTSSYGSALSYIPEIPWNDSCAGALLSSYEGYSTPYGSNGFCNSATGGYFQTTVAGGGGPSACATGTPSVSGDVGGTCQGWPKPAWQSVLGNPSDGVRDTPDVALFAADGLWSHYYVFCWSDITNGGAACSGDPSGWSGAGGTSFASPIMAGIQALVNQKTGESQGNPNPAYYQLAATEYGSNGSSSCNSSSVSAVGSNCVFYDITQGDMDVNCTGSANCYLPSGSEGVLSTSDSSYSLAYGTSTGWDFATGLGSVNAANLVNNWPSPTPNFTLSPSSGNLTLTQGSSGTDTVTVNVLNGFSGNVNLSAFGLPSGVTASFSPNPATTSSTLTLTASSTATIGIYPVTVTGTSGTLTNSTTINVAVNSVGSFTLSALPSSMSLVQGTGGTTTITVTPQSGFTGGVSLTASGLPVGVTASFSSNPTTTTSTLTLTASSTASAGTFAVTINGASGSLTSTATVSLTVTPPPSFSLTATPGSVSVMEGNSGTSTITVNGQNGFSGSVSLSASGLPSGVTSSFSVNPATTTSTLTLTVSSTAAVGTFPITVTGTSGSLTSTVTVNLTVTNFSLAASPTSLSLVQGSSGASTITVGAQNGFSGSVTLSASGLPSGVTAIFTPNPATGASTLTLTAGSGALTGTATVTITGVSGSLSHTVTVSLTVVAGNASLPSGWADGDIGVVGPAGSASYTSGVFTVKGSGQYVWGTEDGFNFLYEPLVGDGTIVARVVSFGGGASSASAGVMIRETLSGGSTNVYEAYGGGGLVYFDERASSGASTTSQNNGGSVTLPYWLKLVRSGSVFSGYISGDGVNWVQVGTSQTVSMAQGVYVGFAVSSNNNNELATATFDNVSISTGASPAPVITSVSPSTGAVGSQAVITGSGFGGTQGSSVVRLNGMLVTVNTWSATSIGITIPAGASTGPLVVSVGPGMNDSNAVTFTVVVPPSFSLAAAPGSVSVMEGNSGTSTITVNGQNGFSGSVSLSASGLPSGVTASFSSNPTTTTSTLTLTVSSTASAGTYPITVTGTSGSLTSTVTVNLTVTVPPNFSLTASPTSLSLVQGSSGASTITVGAQNGFSGSVTLSASGLPSGVTAIFNPNPTTGASTLTLTAGSGALTGTATVTITGVSGSLSHTVTVSLTVVAGNASLPSGWADGDIGVVGPAGSASYASGVFTVKGSGQYVWGTEDGFNFLYEPLVGDGTIVARVVSFGGGASSASAGVTIRETLSGGSTNVYEAYGGGGLVYFDERASSGGSTTSQNNGGSVTLPYWLKLVRSGSVFSGYISGDGVNWVQVGTSQTVSMAQGVYVGFAVSSNNNNELATATFDNVSLSTGASPAAVITSVSPNTGAVGSQAVITGSGFGGTQGSSVVRLNGMLVTVNTWSATSIGITIPAGASTGPLVVSVGPGMNDSNAVTFTVVVPPSFSLAAAPGSVSVMEGNSGTSTITVNGQNGFSGSVSLSASGLPSGVTASFSSNPTTTTSTLTLTVSSTASAGTYPITVTGTSGSLTSTVTVNLTVTVPPNFSLTASPTSLSLVQGSSGASTITVGAQNGFSGSVTLSASGLPSGVTAIFNPNPTTGASTLTLTAGSGALTGTATVTITGVSGSLSHTVTVSLTVVAGNASLPSGWADGDIGVVGPAGSASYASGVFTVKGSGQYVWGTEDGFNFLYEPLVGDGTIVARVVSFGGGASSASAGVTIRETLSGGSTNVYEAYGGGGLVYFDERASSGGSTTSQNNGGSVTLPYWLKLVRSGSVFSGYISGDGVNWVQVGTSQTVSMAQGVYVGFAVSSNNNNELATATFDNVSITVP
jgi:uncharacterized membrane protein